MPRSTSQSTHTARRPDTPAPTQRTPSTSGTSQPLPPRAARTAPVLSYSLPPARANPTLTATPPISLTSAQRAELAAQLTEEVHRHTLRLATFQPRPQPCDPLYQSARLSLPVAHRITTIKQMKAAILRADLAGLVALNDRADQYTDLEVWQAIGPLYARDMPDLVEGRFSLRQRVEFLHMQIWKGRFDAGQRGLDLDDLDDDFGDWEPGVLEERRRERERLERAGVVRPRRRG